MQQIYIIACTILVVIITVIPTAFWLANLLAYINNHKHKPKDNLKEKQQTKSEKQSQTENNHDKNDIEVNRKTTIDALFAISSFKGINRLTTIQCVIIHIVPLICSLSTSLLITNEQHIHIFARVFYNIYFVEIFSLMAIAYKCYCHMFHKNKKYRLRAGIIVIVQLYFLFVAVALLPYSWNFILWIYNQAQIAGLVFTILLLVGFSIIGILYVIFIRLVISLCCVDVDDSISSYKSRHIEQWTTSNYDSGGATRAAVLSRNSNFNSHHPTHGGFHGHYQAPKEPECTGCCPIGGGHIPGGGGAGCGADCGGGCGADCA